MPEQAIVTARGLGKTWRPRSRERVEAVVDVSLELERGAIHLLRGPSGAGKTTLLALLGTLVRPTAGRLAVDGEDTGALSGDALARLRRRTLGFVFQGYPLVPGMPAWQNVAYPLVPVVLSERERRARAAGLLEELGLGARIHHRPEELSGGEQQRVGIARALVLEPRLLLADEPTSNIDEASVALLMGLLGRLRDRGLTVLVASHDPGLVPRADRVLVLDRGRLVEGGTPCS